MCKLIALEMKTSLLLLKTAQENTKGIDYVVTRSLSDYHHMKNVTTTGLSNTQKF